MYERFIIEYSIDYATFIALYHWPIDSKLGKKESRPNYVELASSADKFILISGNKKTPKVFLFFIDLGVSM